MKPDDPRHGSCNGYTNLGCRCKRCRSAWRTYINDRNHRLGLHKPRGQWLAELAAREPPAHGTEARYTDRRCRCRCAECKKASRDARAMRRARVAA